MACDGALWTPRERTCSTAPHGQCRPEWSSLLARSFGGRSPLAGACVLGGRCRSAVPVVTRNIPSPTRMSSAATRTTRTTKAAARQVLELPSPYFWECFFTFCQRRIPFGENYGESRAARDEAMRRGKETAYRGGPVQPSRPNRGGWQDGPRHVAVGHEPCFPAPF